MATVEQEAQPGSSAQRRSTRRVVTLILIAGVLPGAAVFGGISAWSAIARQQVVSRFDAAVAAHNAATARHDSTLARAQRSLAQASTAGTEMSRAQGALNRALAATGKRMPSCSSADCFDAVNVANARAAAAFGAAMRAASLPAGASALARRLASETAAYQRSWVYMSHSTSLTDVVQRARASEETGNRFYAADNALAAWLKSQAGALEQQETALDQQAAALNRSGNELRLRGASLGIRADIRTAGLSQQPVSSSA